MAVVKMGAICHTIKGKVEGSFFRTNTYGTVLQSNNWSKRGVTPRRSVLHFEQSCYAQAWRAMSEADRQAWYAQPQFLAGRVRFGPSQSPGNNPI